MKRTIVCMLITVVLILSLLVPAGADHVPAQPTKVFPLWNADEIWGIGQYSLDTENQLEGKGCVSINLNGKTNLVLGYRNFDAVDATGVLALEFEMYISDLAMLDDLKNISYGRLEIGSGPKTLPAKIGYDWKNILYDIRKECPRAGWNHVVIFFEDMIVLDSNFDVSDINFLQIYWDYETDCGQDWILKFDNFVLTDRQIAPSSHTPGAWEYDENKHWRFCTECGKKIDEAIHSEHSHPPYVVDREFTCYACGQVCSSLEKREKYAALIQQVKHLLVLSEEDFDLEWMTEQYNALMSEWNALAEDERDLLMGGYGAMLKDVNMAIAVREQEVLILSKYESVIAELIWLKDFLRESNWTFENWERALVIASEVQEAIDGMTRTETKVLSEYGYLAILEEAESRLIFCDPPPQGADEPDEPGQPEEPETPDVPQTPDQPDEPTEPTDKGCFSVLSGGTLLCVALTLPLAVAIRKKKK